ncbi:MULTISPECIES: GTP cyclohydrolase II [Acidiplasma]|jgi:GTP cyclohydrolase II/3,4-dihydroxy 2-butanone 4-phosphate synthase/GTP cyclohydrolase II|uniref:GTP cyclohydrolase-2 n=2 Tax=Acidiplasma TaxID=507753 RepID=A0A0Q0VWJ4_9ARCH|nr:MULTISPECIES: GTP cyclohydrolase II [Acidiplasma]KJE49729.1 GTP cyclohydrolase [Acidiplasma sp. MBA-1]KPV47224.1 GTP cyclohydrolase [Acidiplasma aeolicum]KQB34785.1 GTP cyclohydrolase [Acidiplasma aeolicum]KQB36010.1 GTP cyclohydrolase [Acidiplasma cupricumulans]WMT55677.1 MAG: GTP cyclohydrolase II [Acidiplasma sp.]
MIEFYAKAKLPSRFGNFDIYVFKNDENKDHAVIVNGDIYGRENVPVRIHSECLTGDIMGSLRCDCRDQLLTSLKMIGQSEYGMLIYLRQEGRGIGLLNKIKAYSLEDQGLDTVEANLEQGLPADARNYNFAVEVIKYFKIKSVELITNNPEKIKFLEENGIKISKRIPIIIEPNAFDKFYLETKKDKMGHLL